MAFFGCNRLGFTQLTAILLCALTVRVAVAPQERQPAAQGYVITGRVVDPHQLRPEGAVLMLGRMNDDGSFGRGHVAVGEGGSFVTPRLPSGTYLLEVVRTPHSPTKPGTVVGFSIVRLDTTDVSGVTVAVRRDTAITGRFRMESDNPKAAWPPTIVVNAYVALDGLPFVGGTVAEGASGGRFVLRNAFGPRVLRCGYTLAPGSRWWPSQVILDGVDITNVPTDFSAHENGQLEVVFTQHPARIAGTVTDAQGQPVRAPWILVMSADRALQQAWATTSTVTQGDTMSRFSIPALPGTYLVHAVPHAMFKSSRAARKRVLHLSSGVVSVTVAPRAVTSVTLTARER